MDNLGNTFGEKVVQSHHPGLENVPTVHKKNTAKSSIDAKANNIGSVLLDHTMNADHISSEPFTSEDLGIDTGDLDEEERKLLEELAQLDADDDNIGEELESDRDIISSNLSKGQEEMELSKKDLQQKVVDEQQSTNLQQSSALTVGTANVELSQKENAELSDKIKMLEILEYVEKTGDTSVIHLLDDKLGQFLNVRSHKDLYGEEATNRAIEKGFNSDRIAFKHPNNGKYYFVGFSKNETAKTGLPQDQIVHVHLSADELAQIKTTLKLCFQIALQPQIIESTHDEDDKKDKNLANTKPLASHHDDKKTTGDKKDKVQQSSVNRYLRFEVPDTGTSNAENLTKWFARKEMKDEKEFIVLNQFIEKYNLKQEQKKEDIQKGDSLTTETKNQELQASDIETIGRDFDQAKTIILKMLLSDVRAALHDKNLTKEEKAVIVEKYRNIRTMVRELQIDLRPRINHPDGSNVESLLQTYFENICTIVVKGAQSTEVPNSGKL